MSEMLELHTKRPKGWYVRTIRNGKVRIMGHTFACYTPPTMPGYEGQPGYERVPYTGQLEGETCLFGVYLNDTGSKATHMMPKLYLHSVVGVDHEKSDRLLTRDGYYNWDSWRYVPEDQEESAPRRAPEGAR